MQSYRRFAQAFLGNVYAHRDETVATSGNDIETGNSDEPVGNDPSVDDARSGERRYPSSVALLGESVMGSRSVIGSMADGLRELSTEFELLEHVVDR